MAKSGKPSLEDEGVLMTRRLILLSVVAVIALASAVEGWRYYRAYEHLQDGRSQLDTAARLLRERGLHLQSEELETASRTLLEAREAFAQAESILSSDPGLHLAGYLAWVGDQADALLHLTRMGRASAAIGLETVAAIREAQRLGDIEGVPLSEKVLPLLDAVHPHVQEIEGQLQLLTRERDKISEHGLAPPLAEAVRMLDENLRRLRAGLADYESVRLLAPGVLGYNGPQTYLLLTQDNTELFPTGGLISVYGIVTVDRGRVVALSLDDVMRLWNEWKARSSAYFEPPGPLKRYLLRDWTWALGTSNWSPDFPTAARQAQFFLQEEAGIEVDGVIAINFITIEGLLSVIGPVPMPDYGVTVDANNAIETILEQTHTPRAAAEGKQLFVAALAEKLIGSLLASNSSTGVALAERIADLAAAKQLFVYASDAQLQALLDDLGWSGRVRSSGGDYLMVVDTSVHSTKLNLVLEQSLDMAVRLKENGDAGHRVAVRYKNALPQWADGKSEYLVSQMLGGLYGGYVRLLVPEQSLSQGVYRDGVVSGLEEVAVEAGRASFGSYFALPAGEVASLAFQYLTPAVLQACEPNCEYRLLLQKQSGTRAMPVAVTLHVPPGAKVIGLTLDGEALPRDSLVIRTDLSRDRELVLTFKPG